MMGFVFRIYRLLLRRRDCSAEKRQQTDRIT